MKRLLIPAIFLFFSSQIFSQSIELTPLFGYSFSGKADGYYATYDVKDDITYGGMLSVEVDHMSFVELSYQRTNTKLDVTSFTEGRRQYDLGVEHYQIGALREFQEGQIAPFAKVNLGATRYVQTSNGDERYWLFSAGIGVGAKIWFSDKVGLRLNGNLMLPMEFSGGGIFCGIGTGGSGCSTGVTFNVPLVHFELGAGLIIKLPG